MEDNKLQAMIDRYETTIEEKQEQIWDLEHKLESANAWADLTSWNRPRLAEALDLPVPRLQIELTIKNESHHIWFYSLVYRFTTGEIMAVPMGETNSRGGHNHFRFDTVEDAHREIPFREGTHIRRDAWQLNLPAYAIAQGKSFKLNPIPETQKF